jgi:CRP-like cAMP-binding protein
MSGLQRARGGQPARAARHDGPSIQAIPFQKSGTKGALQLLGDAERERLAHIATIVHVPKDTILYHEGDPADCIFNIVEGVAKTYVSLRNGRRRITSFLFPEDLVGLAESGAYCCTAQAVTSLTLYRLTLPALERLFRSDPTLELHFLCKICHDLREAQRHMVALGRNDARGRLAMFLQMLEGHRERHEELDAPIDLPMTRMDIADYSGLTIEAVSRGFQGLQRDGILRFSDARHVAVTDRQRFEELAAAA